MVPHIQSVLTYGSEGLLIEIECQLSNSLPTIVIVGLGNKAVDESKDRIRSAFASAEIPLPRKRITINLAPADIPKDSTSLDLAIAAAIMARTAQPQFDIKHTQAFIGEIGLNGAVRPVRGIIGKLVAGKRLGIGSFFVPIGNLPQASLVPGVTLYVVENIKALYQALLGETTLPTYQTDDNPKPRQHSEEYENVLSAVAGQPQAKRALEIAAAGGHNILLTGPPGTGKSMLAKALPSLLPPLTHQEILETTHLHSLASNTYDQLIDKRPFRAPHHSSSHISIVGGGTYARPGELTLSHHGVLLLDEMPEFSRQTLEALRQPLEERIITVARARQTVEYPARFILVATANPCPCGYYGSDKDCQCSAHQIQRYQQKLSGPILDRIDLFVTVHVVEHSKLLSAKPSLKVDQEVRRRICKARGTQEMRLASPGTLNSDMNNRDIIRFSLLEAASEILINSAAEHLRMSARSYMRVLKVARTIADLEDNKTVKPAHISEALQYRIPIFGASIHELS